MGSLLGRKVVGLPTEESCQGPRPEARTSLEGAAVAFVSVRTAADGAFGWGGTPVI